MSDLSCLQYGRLGISSCYDFAFVVNDTMWWVFFQIGYVTLVASRHIHVTTLENNNNPGCFFCLIKMLRYFFYVRVTLFGKNFVLVIISIRRLTVNHFQGYWLGKSCQACCGCGFVVTCTLRDQGTYSQNILRLSRKKIILSDK